MIDQEIRFNKTVNIFFSMDKQFYEQQTLFEIEPTVTQKNPHTCRECQHRQRWDFSDKIFQYCDIRKSGRTSNGLLKIKCKNEACALFKLVEK